MNKTKITNFIVGWFLIGWFWNREVIEVNEK